MFLLISIFFPVYTAALVVHVTIGEEWGWGDVAARCLDMQYKHALVHEYTIMQTGSVYWNKFTGQVYGYIH